MDLALSSNHSCSALFNSLPVLGLQVVLLGIDIISALVSRLQDRFKAQIGTGEGVSV